MTWVIYCNMYHFFWAFKDVCCPLICDFPKTLQILTLSVGWVWVWFWMRKRSASSQDSCNGEKPWNVGAWSFSDIHISYSWCMNYINLPDYANQWPCFVSFPNPLDVSYSHNIGYLLTQSMIVAHGSIQKPLHNISRRFDWCSASGP